MAQPEDVQDTSLSRCPPNFRFPRRRPLRNQALLQAQPRTVRSSCLPGRDCILGIYSHSFYDFKQHQTCRRLGTKPIPRIRGKWPGNIDVLLRMMKAFKTAYLMDVYLELFQEYQCTTLNTRILWVDQVRSNTRIFDCWTSPKSIRHFIIIRSLQWKRST